MLLYSSETETGGHYKHIYGDLQLRKHQILLKSLNAEGRPSTGSGQAGGASQPHRRGPQGKPWVEGETITSMGISIWVYYWLDMGKEYAQADQREVTPWA